MVKNGYVGKLKERYETLPGRCLDATDRCYNAKIVIETLYKPYMISAWTVLEPCGIVTVVNRSLLECNNAKNGRSPSVWLIETAILRLAQNCSQNGCVEWGYKHLP